MTPFLKQVAAHYHKSGIADKCCFIFPNRRSMAFFSKYLGEEVASGDASGRLVPLLVPQMWTINDFFFKVSGKRPYDRVRLLLTLYDCYKELNPKAEQEEPLDEFIFWGDIILSDFNDVDKYLVDPKQIFTNVADFKQMQDTFSYLSENQRQAIESFIRNFRDGAGQLTVHTGSGKQEVKEKFLYMWNLLYDLYSRFNERLAEEGVAYEGMVYRNLAERLGQEAASDIMGEAFQGVETFVFVGLNALNECEKTLMRKLRDASMAQFCWDYSGELIKDRHNRSSVFMSGNIEEFPQAASWDGDGVSVPEFNVVNVSSSVGQAKRLPDIIGTIDGNLMDCAIVLPDENLLIPVLNSIPETVQDINVTMGLPLRGSLICSLMSLLSSAQLHIVNRNGRWMFYSKPVWEVFSNSLFREVADESTVEKVEAVRKAAKYYIPVEDLGGTELLDTLFKVAVADIKARSAAQIRDFAAYQKDVISIMAGRMASRMQSAIELEYAKEYYRCVNILQGISLDVLPGTYVRLLDRLLSSVSVPFKGEPLKGLQIMGPLETRALDFRHLIILSVNEGVFPRRNVSSSFIPPELRKGFGLPTYEYQDAVWAYYFYRMITRAEKVWLLTDSRTDGLKSGEESRYIKQLEYHFGLPLNRFTVKYGNMKTAVLPPVEKTEEDVKKIRGSVLSASSIKSYLSCPAKFYYATVKGLSAEEEMLDSVDGRILGNIFHEVMRSVYTSERAMATDFWFDREGVNEKTLTDVLASVSRAHISSWLKREKDLKNKINSLIIRSLNCLEVTGRNLVIADVILQYVLKTLSRDLELLNENKVDSFRILGMETEIYGTVEGQRMKGFIDRLDSFSEDSVRVVDYKTGSVCKEDEDIDDVSAERIADMIFTPDIKNRPEIAFQFYVYDMLLDGCKEAEGKAVYNSVYAPAALFANPPKVVPENRKFIKAVSERLGRMFEEMYDVNIPFRRTDNDTVCAYCDFKSICGRG